MDTLNNEVIGYYAINRHRFQATYTESTITQGQFLNKTFFLVNKMEVVTQMYEITVPQGLNTGKMQKRKKKTDNQNISVFTGMFAVHRTV